MAFGTNRFAALIAATCFAVALTDRGFLPRHQSSIDHDIRRNGHQGRFVTCATILHILLGVTPPVHRDAGA